MNPHSVGHVENKKAMMKGARERAPFILILGTGPGTIACISQRIVYEDINASEQERLERNSKS